jgi:hypothetical protein
MFLLATLLALVTAAILMSHHLYPESSKGAKAGGAPDTSLKSSEAESDAD